MPGAKALPVEDYALRRGVGTRAMGLGGAYTAIADDGSAVFYNPACLAQPGVCYTFGNPDAEERHFSGGFEFLKLGYVGYGSWQFQDPASREVATTALGFGNRSGWLSWGMTYKGHSWNTAGPRTTGWSTDIGFLVRVSPQLDVGLVAQDLFTGKDSLAPASARLGLGLRPLDSRLVLAADLELNRQGRSFGHLGLEANLVQGLSLRGGIDRGEPTAGLTLDLAVFSFDYAARFDDQSRATHSFEMGLKVIPARQRPFSIIKPKEFALIKVSGALVGGRTEYSFLGGYRQGLDSLLGEIRKAARDSSIDGIMLKISGFSGGLGGMAMVQELRAELQRAREKGKKIVAYVEGSAVGDEYYLASVADRIVAPPGTAIGGFGKSIGILRLQGAFKKFGIDWQVFRQGKYKAAFDPYSEKLTPDQEEMVKGIAADLYRQLLTEIAADRRISLEKLKEIGDGMIFPARLAREMGLVDEIGYFQDAKKAAAVLAGEQKDEAKLVEPRDIRPDEFFLTKVFGVAIIELDGEIVSGSGGENVLFGGRSVGSETVARFIRKASDDIFIKAIILRVNSPGGDAIAAGEIYQAVQYAKEKKKKVIASIGSIGASGGYYIAAAADRIVADQASLTGSIGVIGYLPVYHKLLKEWQIKSEMIKEGEHADMFSGLRDLTTVEVQAVERLQNESYWEFVQAVVKGRGLSTAEVEAAAEGRLYTGSQALEAKLIDQLGSFSDAVDLARREAEIMGEPRLIFYHEPSLFFSFGEGIVESLGLRRGLWGK